MAKRAFNVHSYTPTTLADGTAASNNTYQSIEAQNPTMYIEVMEIYEGGQATSSAVNVMQFARSQTIVNTATALSSATATDAFTKTFSTALAASAVVCVAATSGPIRSTVASGGRLNLSFNSFGGIVRWVAAPYEEWGILGTVVSTAGSFLSSYNSGTPGAMGSHLVYEIF